MYHEFTPCAALVPFIDKFWVFKGFTDIGTRFKILADGCTDFIFSIGNMTVPTDEHSMFMQPYRSFFVGPMRSYSNLTATTDSLHMLGVRFQPCGLAAFTNEPLGQFADLRIQSSDINLLFDNSFAEMLCEQPDDSVRIRIIEGYLIRLLTQSIQVDRQIIYATSFIKQSYGQLPVQNLIDKICICQRHFQRKFKDATGYTPKEFSRIIKFQYAIEVLRNAPHTDLSSIALDCGYYDHSHFIKEFKRLAGDVPSYFLTLPNPADEPLTYI